MVTQQGDPPPQWPQELRDDVERMLRDDVVKGYLDGVSGLRVRYRRLGIPLEFDKEPARSWIARRLVERLFPWAEVLVVDRPAVDTGAPNR
jgi:hypothetical protein